MSSLAGKSILILDDAEDVRMLARRILENDGATVHTAESVAEGLQLAETVGPHLVITDLGFPGSDGFFFLDQRKTNGAIMNVPVIVLSGMNDRESVVKAVSLGASDFLIKPFRATLLLQKARKHLRVASFAAVNFAESGFEPVDVSVQAEITSLSESGFLVDAPVKLAADQLVEVEAQFLMDLGLENVLLKTGSRPAHYLNNGRHANQILFTGVGEEFARQLRQKIKG